MPQIPLKYVRTAEDECSGKTETMDYVKCRANKMEKEQGTSPEKAFPTAWSIACKYKRDQLSDADEHCQRKPSGYFTKKKAHAQNFKLEQKMNINNKYFSKSLMASEEMLELMAGHTPESFQQMYQNMSKEDQEKWDAMNKEHGSKFKEAGCENLPNKPMQDACEAKKKKPAEEEAEAEKEKTDKAAAKKIPSSWKKKFEAEVIKSGLGSGAISSWTSPEIIQGYSMFPKDPIKAAKGWVVGMKKNKKAKKASQNLTANWGLTAEETYEMLAEEELEAYLAELDMMAYEEMLAAKRGRPVGSKTKNTDNGSFERYHQSGKAKSKKSGPSLKDDWIPNGFHSDRKGKPNAGGGAGVNHIYNDYGSGATSDMAKYQREYERDPEKRKTTKTRTNCPNMQGGSFKCKNEG